MKKTAAKERRSIRPRGRSPVITVRVPEALYDRIRDSAGDATMSERMADLLKRAFEWEDVFGDIKQMHERAKNIDKENFEIEMRRRGYKPLRGKTKSNEWIKQDVPDGFIPDSEISRIEAGIEDLERRLAALKAQQTTKGK